MRMRWLMAAVVGLMIVASAMAQERAPRAIKDMHQTQDHMYFETPTPPPGPPGLPRIPMAWWKDSHLSQQLNLTDTQKAKLEQTFTEHKIKLIDLRANLEKEETRLQPLIESDRLDENQVSAQLDKVIAARGQLEKATAMMSVDMRKILTQEQWKKLQTVQSQMPTPGPEHGFFVRGPEPGRPPKAMIQPKPPSPPEGPNGPDGKGRPTEEQPR